MSADPKSRTNSASTNTQSDVRPVETVEPTPIQPTTGPSQPKSIYRSVSLLGWAFVLFAFVINRKLGVVVFLMMLLLVVFPQITSSNVARGAGKTWKKFKSGRGPN